MSLLNIDVKGSTTEALIKLVKEVVVDHHEVTGFEQMRSPAKQTIGEWYNDAITKVMECKEVFGYKLYSGDEDFPSETLLTVTAVGRIRVQSSIQ